MGGPDPDPLALDAVAGRCLGGAGGGGRRRALRLLHVGGDGGSNVGVDRPGVVGRRVPGGAGCAPCWRGAGTRACTVAYARVRVTRFRIVLVVPGFVIERDEPGMAAVVDVVERISRRDHDCRVVALRHPPARPAYELAGARVIALGAGRTGGARGRAAVLARGVVRSSRLHDRRRVDLVHGLWLDEPGAVATIAGRLIRRPVVASVMGGELVASAGHRVRRGAADGAGDGPRRRRSVARTS